MGAKENVKENLIRLRREHKLTQLELSERINYSDKAISRWENGEVTPDVETLEHLATLYGIPITSFFLPAGEQLSKQERKAQKRAAKKQKKTQKESMGTPKKGVKDPTRPRRIALLIASLCFLWTVALTLFFILDAAELSGAFYTFIWGLPATFAILFTYFFLRRHTVTSVVFLSLFAWSALAATYLQISVWRLYPLLFLGIPLQTAILLLPFLKKKN